jgi:TonB family protein
MALRCLLFSSDEGTAEPIRQVLAGLGVVGEHCSDAGAAVEKVTHQNFQIVIIDWDKQPEAALLLQTARERKATERPLTLAIVSDDGNVPKALQAGANSILRKPLLGNQVKDILTTARDLLRAKQESATAAAQAAAAGVSASSSVTPPATIRHGAETPLRAGEFLESFTSVPNAQFVTKSHAPEFVSSFEVVDSPKGLEPATASVAEEKPSARPPAPALPLPPDKPRGLEWYLKTRAGVTSSVLEHAPAPPTPAKPELLGYDQTPSHSAMPEQPKSDVLAGRFAPQAKPNEHSIQEHKKEAELFAYMAGEAGGSQGVSRPKSRLGKGAIIGALALAGCAIMAAPQAPWHSKMLAVWARGHQAMHGWLNPQPVTPAQAPVAHEDFGRAGDEYKMPVGETIPDATTDPSQIQVVPVIDPTVKKTNNDTPSPDQPAAPADGVIATQNGQTPDSAVQVQEKPLSSSTSEMSPPANGPTEAGTPSSSGSTIVPTPVVPLRSDSRTDSSTSFSVPSVSAQSAPPKYRPPHEVLPRGNVPSSLKSQLASMTPDSSGNKAPETAMPSIEPVVVPEAAERALLTDQPVLAYPANAKGQATVVLQVLIGRDGTVQDAKFLQGSLAFARAAIDGVKQWKFKAYTMNGRAVSVQTLLTMSFKPRPLN